MPWKYVLLAMAFASSHHWRSREPFGLSARA